jgi:glycosyltransferase involved in cell wall biosynthesis/SAM-dependent methyltransferase
MGEVVPTRLGADKEAAEDVVADVHRIEASVRAGRSEPQPHLRAGERLVPACQVGRPLVPRADAGHGIRERMIARCPRREGPLMDPLVMEDRTTLPATRTVLELRSAEGAGGGPEKTIIAGAGQVFDPATRVHVCYLRCLADPSFSVGDRCRGAGVRYVEVTQRFPGDPGVLRQLRAAVRRLGIDIVHSHDYKSDLYALALARLEGIVPLATAHGWTGQSWREGLLYYPANKLALRRFPRVVAVSSEIKRELVRWGVEADRVTVLLNGIDPVAFRRRPAQVEAARRAFGVEPGRIVLGAVGRLEPQKRFDQLLEAVARLRRVRDDLLLLIAGEGGERGRLEQQIAALGLEKDCRLLGHVSDPQLLYHALELFVQSSAYEGTANVLLEAMALEVPVVATAVGGTEELIADGTHGLIVPPGSPERLAEAIGRALDDHGATARRTAAARRRIVEELSFDRRTQQLHAIYHELKPDSAAPPAGQRPAPGRTAAVWLAERGARPGTPCLDDRGEPEEWTLEHEASQWDREALIYEETRGRDTVYMHGVRAAVAALALDPEANVLDAGCGTGLTIQEYQHQVRAITALDLSERSLEYVRRRCPTARIVAGNLTQLPFEDDQFTHVLCANALTQLRSEELRRQAVGELVRVLRPGGLLVVSVQHYSVPRQRRGWLKEGKPNQPGVGYIYRFSGDEFADLLADFVERPTVRSAGFALPYRWKLSPVSNLVERVLRKCRAATPYGHLLIGAGRKPLRPKPAKG